MTSPLTDPMVFAGLLQRFFAERLLQQKNASPRTIEAYRDTFRLLLRYAARETGKPPARLALGDCDAPLVLGYLTHLETQRHNTARSRNARLAAVRAFAHYIAWQCPEALPVTQRILAIPMKRFEKPLLGFMHREEVQAVLAAPDASTWCGRRDRVLLAVLYNTGARVSELIGIRVADVTLAATSSIRLHGKGRKQRTVPLWRPTAMALRDWLRYADLRADQPLVPNRSGMPMTRTSVAERLALAVGVATTSCPTLRGRRISPHTLRHYIPSLTMSCDMDALSKSYENNRSQRRSTQPITRHSLPMFSTDHSGKPGVCLPADSALAGHAAERFLQGPAPSSRVSLRDKSAWSPPIHALAIRQ